MPPPPPLFFPFSGFRCPPSPPACSSLEQAQELPRPFEQLVELLEPSLLHQSHRAPLPRRRRIPFSVSKRSMSSRPPFSLAVCPLSPPRHVGTCESPRPSQPAAVATPPQEPPVSSALLLPPHFGELPLKPPCPTGAPCTNEARHENLLTGRPP
jgi:hypothetical protein